MKIATFTVRMEVKSLDQAGIQQARVRLIETVGVKSVQHEAHITEAESGRDSVRTESQGGKGSFLPFAVFGLLAVLLTIVAPARAWEFPSNPDRFPSVGLTVNNENLSGDRSEVVYDSLGEPLPFNNDDDSRIRQEFGADVRLPVNNGITFTLMYSHIEEESQFNRYSSLTHAKVYNESGRLSGYRYGFNLRLYFNK